MQDLVAGQIDMMFDLSSNSLPQVRTGQIKAYARHWPRRAGSRAPDIPTVDEAGVPGFYISFWHGLWVPKGTPKDIIAKLNAAVDECAGRSDACASASPDSGQEIPPREQQTPEALAAHHKAEIEKWWPIIKAAEHQGRTKARPDRSAWIERVPKRITAARLATRGGDFPDRAALAVPPRISRVACVVRHEGGQAAHARQQQAEEQRDRERRAVAAADAADARRRARSRSTPR